VTRRYEWIFLDAGETLFQVGSPLAGFGEVLADLGYPMPAERLEAIVQRARRQTMVADHVGPGPEYSVDVERARARRERLVGAIVEGVGVCEADYEACQTAVSEAFVGRRFFGLYPEVPEVLTWLTSRGYRLGIISNWEPRLDALCRSHGLDEYLDFVLASEAEGFAKPGPHLFRRALERAEVEPGRAVHVGDSFEHDVLGATAVGIRAILLDRGGFYPSGQWQPTIGSLAQLPAHLEAAAHSH